MRERMMRSSSNTNSIYRNSNIGCTRREKVTSPTRSATPTMPAVATERTAGRHRLHRITDISSRGASYIKTAQRYLLFVIVTYVIHVFVPIIFERIKKNRQTIIGSIYFSNILETQINGVAPAHNILKMIITFSVFQCPCQPTFHCKV